MTGDKEKAKSRNEVTGYIFVGCIVTGMGISFALGNMPVGLFIGLGVGFITRGLMQHKASQRNKD